MELKSKQTNKQKNPNKTKCLLGLQLEIRNTFKRYDRFLLIFVVRFSGVFGPLVTETPVFR